MFISPAYAQAAGGGLGSFGAMGQFLPLILIFVVFYFLLIAIASAKTIIAVLIRFTSKLNSYYFQVM